MDPEPSDAGTDGEGGEPLPKRARTDSGLDAPENGDKRQVNAPCTDVDPPPWDVTNGMPVHTDGGVEQGESDSNVGSAGPAENGGDGGGNDSDSLSDDDEDGDSEDGGGGDVLAFEGELRAHLANGRTILEAVGLIFGGGEDDADGGGESGLPEGGAEGGGAARHVAVLSRLAGLGKPIIAALKNDPDLCESVEDVASLCAAMYHLVEDDIHDAVTAVVRPRLDLNIAGIEDVVKLVEAAQNVVVLSGAGVSVSCGIPDFRSTGGVYDTVLNRYGLSDPQAIFDLTEFRLDPTLFYSFAKDIMPSESIKPSLTHYFIAELDRRGKLLRNYSQNIDGLEHRAGITPGRVVLCHGSFLTATCMLASCRKQVCGSSISTDVKSGKVPMCQSCDEKSGKKGAASDDSEDDDDGNEWSSVLKPDIVFFGENLPKSVSDNLTKDAPVADLVLVLGTSLQVAPVSRIPQQFADSVPRLLVNRELVGYNFDVELLGNCDGVVAELCTKLGWTPNSGSAVKTSGAAAGAAKAAEAKSVTSPVMPLVPSAMDKADGAEHADANGDADAGEKTGFEFRPPRKFVFPGAIVPEVESSDESSDGSSDGGEDGATGLQVLFAGNSAGVPSAGGDGDRIVVGGDANAAASAGDGRADGDDGGVDNIDKACADGGEGNNLAEVADVPAAADAGGEESEGGGEDGGGDNGDELGLPHPKPESGL